MAPSYPNRPQWPCSGKKERRRASKNRIEAKVSVPGGLVRELFHHKLAKQACDLELVQRDQRRRHAAQSSGDMPDKLDRLGLHAARRRGQPPKRKGHASVNWNALEWADDISCDFMGFR